jgi:hypothetical protein
VRTTLLFHQVNSSASEHQRRFMSPLGHHHRAVAGRLGFRHRRPDADDFNVTCNDDAVSGGESDMTGA